MAAQSYSESSDYVHIEQLDGSKEKKEKKDKEDKKDKKEKKKKRREELELPDRRNVEEISLYGLSRGLQIGAVYHIQLSYGFPFPKYLETHGVTTQNWATFMEAICQPIALWDESFRGHAYELESILDIVSRWDSEWFRKKGLVLRMDMPGEERYGLDFMDLYNESIDRESSRLSTKYENPHKKTYNVAAGTAGVILKGKMKEANPKELKAVRKSMFESTRLVIDLISVLDNQSLYEKHGWARWDKQCAHAKKALLNLPKEKPVVVDNEPWDFKELEPPTRKDRWPPSKHFNYERYRGRVYTWVTYTTSYSIGHSITIAHFHRFWLPDRDSMDQRQQGEDGIIPCDELPRQIFQARPLYNILHHPSSLPR